MTARVLDGNEVAAQVKAGLVGRIARLAERGITPGLGTILVGDDGPSANYVAMKHRDCAELGIASKGEHLPASATTADVIAVVEAYNADPAVDAVLIQYPFPAGVDYEAALLRLGPAKDGDGLHPVNLGRLVMGTEAPVACTPAGIKALLEHYEIPVAG